MFENIRMTLKMFVNPLEIGLPSLSLIRDQNEPMSSRHSLTLPYFFWFLKLNDIKRQRKTERKRSTQTESIDRNSNAWKPEQRTHSILQIFSRILGIILLLLQKT